MRPKDLVVLVHGFNRNQRDMLTLRNNLQNMGHSVFIVNLPMRFQSLENCSALFEEKLKEIARGESGSRKIHLVGHSMGGLVIRGVLGKDLSINLGRCVLIATPNKGTKLADMTKAVCKYSIQIFKPLKSLINGGVEIPPPGLQTETGVIAGSKNNILWGVFLSKESDGKVEIESTKLDEMKDFIVINYNHDEIHHKYETAELVHRFLQNGRFF